MPGNIGILGYSNNNGIYQFLNISLREMAFVQLRGSAIEGGRASLNSIRSIPIHEFGGSRLIILSIQISGCCFYSPL